MCWVPCSVLGVKLQQRTFSPGGEADIKVSPLSNQSMFVGVGHFTCSNPSSHIYSDSGIFPLKGADRSHWIGYQNNLLFYSFSSFIRCNSPQYPQGFPSLFYSHFIFG